MLVVFLLFLLTYVLLSKNNISNYTNYAEYDKMHVNPILNCPEQFEIGIDQISKLRKNNENYVLQIYGYTEDELLDSLRYTLTDKPIPMSPDFMN